MTIIEVTDSESNKPQRMSKRTELLHTVDEESLHQLILRIESEASEYFKVYIDLGLVLWRGTQVSNFNAYESHSPIDRTPLDSNKSASIIFDQALRELGFKAVRSNSIFATSDIGQTAFYGKPYAIIPKNTASFTWSPRINDLVLLADTLYHRGVTKNDSMNDIDLEKFKNSFQFDNTDFARAVKSRNEVMISGEYFAISKEIWDKELMLGDFI